MLLWKAFCEVLISYNKICVVDASVLISAMRTVVISYSIARTTKVPCLQSKQNRFAVLYLLKYEYTHLFRNVGKGPTSYKNKTEFIPQRA